MVSEKILQALYGTENQVREVKAIIEQFDTIKLTVLEYEIIVYKTSQSGNKVMHYFNMELTASIKDLNKYFELLKINKEVFFNDLINFIS